MPVLDVLTRATGGRLQRPGGGPGGEVGFAFGGLIAEGADVLVEPPNDFVVAVDAGDLVLQPEPEIAISEGSIETP